MTWMKVDDGLHSHRKALRAGAEAMGLWVMAGSWVGSQLTDGFVPDYVARQFVADLETVAGRLVAAGLWEPGELDGDEGWWFKDWLTFNFSREQVLEKRRKDAEKQARGRAKQAEMRSKGRSARKPGRHQVTPPVSPSGPVPVPGTPPSSGYPGSAGRGAERPPVPAAVAEARERFQRPPSPEGLAAARAALDAVVPRSKRPADRRGRRRAAAGQLPMVATVRVDPAAAQRDEQDRLAELEVTQAPTAGASRASPPDRSPADDRPDQQEQAS